jgi:hypothetical protein
MDDTELVRQHIDQVQAEILAVVRRHSSNANGYKMAAHALIELTGSVCAAIVEAEPSMRAFFDEKLGDLRLFVAATSSAGSRAQ